MLLQKITFFSFVLTLVLLPLAQAVTKPNPLDSATLGVMMQESNRRINATVEEMKLLMQQRARKRIQEIPCSANELLISITKSGSVRLLQNLLETNDIDINYIDRDGNTALAIAAKNGALTLVQMLLKAGADGLLQDGQGFSALHIATQEGHEDVVKTLINTCDDPVALINTCDKHDQLPIILALGKDQHHIVELLLQCGTSVDLNDALEFADLTDTEMLTILGTYLL